MKKILITFALLSLCFSFTKIAGATSGACSSHGGVNCGAGQTASGNAICNDGWAGSSVPFYQVDECMNTHCMPPIDYGCKTENDYAIMQLSQIRSGSQEFMNQISSGYLIACRDQINKYAADLASYRTCLTNSIHQSDNTQQQNSLTASLNTICTDSLGVNSFYDSNQKACYCNKGYGPSLLITKLQCSLPSDYCKERMGENSHPIEGAFSNPIGIKYVSASEYCACNKGYIFVDNRCITYTDNCKNTYGINVSGSEDASSTPTSSCHCNQGYKWSNDGKSCVIDFNNYILNQKVTATTTSAISVKVSYAFSTSNLNIRGKANASSKIVGSFKKNTKYQITDLSNKDWVKIKYTGNKEGYVLKRLVKVN